MEFVKAFIAGFVSTLVFHQGAMVAMHAAGLWPKPAYPMTPTAPLKVPAVISLAFWGGLWGIVLWLAIRGQPELRYWLIALLVGAIGPTIVALFVVAPLKGQPAGAGGDRKIILGALLLNGIWGLGVALLMRLMAGF